VLQITAIPFRFQATVLLARMAVTDVKQLQQWETEIAGKILDKKPSCR